MVKDEEGPKAVFPPTSSAQVSLHFLHSPSVTSRNKGVGSSVSSIGQVNFRPLDITDLRIASLELATLGLLRISNSKS